jgi:hypothetical protein
MVLIPYLFWLADAISFRKDYSPPSSLPSRPYNVAHLSCCSQNQGARGVIVAQRGHQRMRSGELGPTARGAQRAVVLWTGRARGRRSRRDGGKVRVRCGANSLESSWIRRSANVRRVLQTRGRYDGARCACRAEKNQRTKAIYVGVQALALPLDESRCL